MHHIPSKLFRQGLIAAAFVLQFVLLCTGAFADSPAKDGYNPDVDGLVYTSVIQPDGKLVIGGLFNKVKGVAHANIARINVDGSLDTSFTAVADGPVRVMLRHSNGTLLIGGEFTTISQIAAGATVATSPVSRMGLARLSTSGVVDTTWSPGVKQASIPALFKVRALAFQHDGKVLVGGRFDTYVGATDSSSTSTTVTKTNVLRLTPEGKLDTSFKVVVNDVVMAILVRPDSKIVLGGGFTKASTLPSGTDLSFEVGRIAMYSGDGTLITGFNTYFNSRIDVLLNSPTGGFYVGGAFTTIQPYDSTVTAPAHGVTRSISGVCLLNDNGSLSSTFASSANGEVYALALQPDGSLLVGGNITEIVSADPYIRAGASYVGRVLASGYPDQSFYAGLNEMVTSIAVQGDGNILLSGYFARVTVNGDALSTPRNHVARVQTDGTLDTDFSFAPSGKYSNIQVLSDGTFLVNGSFSDIGGATRTGIAILSSTGALKASFANVRINGSITAAALQSDGKLVIGGAFTGIKQNGDTSYATRLYIARLNADGTLDTAFVPPTLDGSITTLALQADGKVLISGSFSTITTGTTATSQYYMARLNADGTHDTSFVPAPSLPPTIIRVRDDGKIWVAGEFTFFNPNGSTTTVYKGYLAVLNSDGTVDKTFGTSLNGAVSSFSVQSDGKIYVSGAFNGLSVLVGTTTYTISGVARLNSDGALDSSFVVQTNGSVNAVYADTDYIYLGGSFTTIKDIAHIDASTSLTRYYMSRVTKTGVIDATYNPNPDYVVRKILPLSNSRLLVVGDFAGFSPNNASVASPALGMGAIFADGTVDTSFFLSSPKPSNTTDKINFILHEPDAYLMVGGQFTGLNGSLTSNLMRMTAAGRRDTSFNGAPNGEVTSAVALPVEPSVLSTAVGFTWLKSAGTVEQVRIGKLPEINGYVLAIARQSDGKILLGGSFYITDNKAYSNLIRLNTDGTLDTTFWVSINSSVYSMVVLDDDSILLGGEFTTVETSSVATTERNYMARLTKNGQLDTVFNPNFDAMVKTILVSADKKSFYAVGAFTTVYGVSTATTTTSRAYIAKLALSDATVDTAFVPYANSQVNTIVLQSDGKLLIGGAFTNIQGTSATSYTARKYIARLNADGSLDSFDPGADAMVSAITLEADGNILVGGSFANFYPNATTTATPMKYFARLNKDSGLVDTTLNLSLNGTVNTIAVQSSKDIIIGGSFSTVKALNRIGLVRISKDGTVGDVLVALVYSSTQVINIISSTDATLNDTILLGGSFSRARAEPFMYVGGSFTQISEYKVTNMARIYIDGAVDVTFLPNPNGKVCAMIRQADGKVLVGGEFTSIAGKTLSNLVRFNADGSLDTSFAVSFATPVHALTQTASGQILVGGSTGIIARIKTDGTLDSSFSGSVGGDVTSIGIAANGDVLVGSLSTYFTALNSSTGAKSSNAWPSVNGVVNSIAVAVDGTVSIGGSFTTVGTTTVSNFARINSDYTVATNLPTSIDGPVTTVMLTEDGKAMLGGNFGTIDTLPRFMLARIAAPAQAKATTVQRLTYNESDNALVWTRSGSVPTITRAYIESSTDDVTWTPVGTSELSLVGNDWRLSNIKLEATSTYNLRVRGVLQSTPGGSSGIIFAKLSGTGSTLSGMSRLPDRVFTLANVVVNLTEALGLTPSSVTGLPAGLEYNAITGTISGIPTSTGSGVITITWFDGIFNRTSTINYTTIDTAYVANSGQRVGNVSIRATVPANQSVVAGLVIKGSAPKKVLLRAVGPTLADFKVSAPMLNPTFTLTNTTTGTPVVVQANVGAWGGNADVKAAMAAVYAFGLKDDSNDCAILVTLPPGNYTFDVKDKNNAGGTVLLEAYDAAADHTEAQHIINISGRATASTGSNVMVVGFILTNVDQNVTQTQRVLIRAVGRTLLGFGVELPMRDPILHLYRITTVTDPITGKTTTTNTLIAQNDDWGVQANISGSVDHVFPLTTVLNSIKAAYAFSFGVDDTKSSAMVLDLPLGQYTAEAISVDGFSGPVILELYQIQ